MKIKCSKCGKIILLSKSISKISNLHASLILSPHIKAIKQAIEHFGIIIFSNSLTSCSLVSISGSLFLFDIL